MRCAVVAALFNPFCHQTRWDNWDRCLASLRETEAPVYAVELTEGTKPRMTGADKHIHVTKGDILWQKEALLNLGIEQVRQDGYDGVVWLDADVVIPDPTWFYRLQRKLEQFDLMQVWERGFAKFTDNNSHLISAADRWLTKQDPNGHPGGGWAARLTAIPQGLFPYFVIGGADRFMWRSFLHAAGQLDLSSVPWFQRSAPLRQAWERWTRNLPPLRVGCLTSYIEMLIHGSLQNRKYGPRCSIYDFISPCDVKKNEQGALEWMFNATEQAELVLNYMMSRGDEQTA